MAPTTAPLSRVHARYRITRRHLPRWEPESIDYRVQTVAGMRFDGGHLR